MHPRALLAFGMTALLTACSSTPKKFQTLDQLDRKNTKAAVVDLLNPHNQETALGKYMADQLTLRLSNTGMQFFDRSQIRRIIEEQNLNVASSDFAQNFGQILGADVLVLGSYYSLDQHYESTVKIVEVKTGRILSIDTLHFNHSLALAKLDQPVPQNSVQVTKKTTNESVKKVESTSSSRMNTETPTTNNSAENPATASTQASPATTNITTPFEEDVYTNFPEKGITVGDEDFRFTLQSCKALSLSFNCSGIAKSKVSGNFEAIPLEVISKDGKRLSIKWFELYGKMNNSQIIKPTIPMSFGFQGDAWGNQFSIISFIVKFNNKEYPIIIRNVQLTR